MNHIVLIGNGFDLAHGLKTSYKDFFSWYEYKIALNIMTNNSYFDRAIKIKAPTYQQNDGSYVDYGNPFQNGKKPSLENGIIEELKKYKYNPEPETMFAKELFLNFWSDKKWVDIESLYYKTLKRIYKLHSNELSSTKESALKGLISCNESLTEIKTKLGEYLFDLFGDNTTKLSDEIHIHFKSIKNQLNQSRKSFMTIVNFNYTPTVKKYFDENDLNNNVNIINIHGELLNPENPIIFGYGDETDSYYKELEDLNNNEFLKHMKSFGYANTQNYQKLISSMQAGKYEVHIMGHSCGLSDRVLLKSIFENELCQKITQYYYQYDDDKDDYIDKYMDISRHFSLNKKEVMREKIRSKNECKPLIKFTPIKKGPEGP